MDQMPAIISIVRDGIVDGLIRGENVRRFNRKVKTLKGAELEAYLQDLWDRYPPPNYAKNSQKAKKA